MKVVRLSVPRTGRLYPQEIVVVVVVVVVVAEKERLVPLWSLKTRRSL